MATILLHSHHISANITDRYAMVVYSFQFENSRSLKHNSDELKFEITIDPHAFISKFKANIDGAIFIGKTKEKEKASKEYCKAKEKNENAILISQPYDNIPHVFEIKTNIDAQSNVSLDITIEQYLQKRFNYNQLDVQILRNFAQYNIKQNYKHISFELNIFDESGIYDIQIPSSVEMRKSVEGIAIKNENNIIIEDKSIDELNKKCILIGTIDSKLCINELSLKYKIKGEQNASHILFDTKSHTFCHIISDIITDSMINEGQSMFIPRRVVFVIDKSGSMRGMKWQNTVNATIEALKQLNISYDRYNILLFDTNIHLFCPKSIIMATEQNIANSVKYLQNVNVGKGTNINDALLNAVELIKDDIENCESHFYMNQIVFITDGKPFNGERNTHKITLNVKDSNNLKDIDKYNNKISIFSFGVGKDENDSRWIHDLNHSFLKILSLNNNGFYKRIKQTTADTALNECFNVLSKPILLNVNIQYKNKNIRNLTQTSFNSFYAGNDIIICGKIDDIEINNHYELQATITAITAINTLKTDNKLRVIQPITISKDIILMIYAQDYNNNANIERIWAYLTLQHFVRKQLIHNDMIQIDDDDKKENTDEISPLSLALKYHFVTPWSSMIVIKEKKDEYKQNDDDPQTHSQLQWEPPVWAKRMKNKVSKTRAHTNVRSWAKTGYLPHSNSTQRGMMKEKMVNQPHKEELRSTVKRIRTIWITGPTEAFSNDYVKMAQIGNTGKYGVVYQCKRKSDGKIFAVKFLNKNICYRINVNHRHRYLQAMCNEIDVLQTSQHKYIANLEKIYEDKTILYIVMEYCEGGDLLKRIVNKGKWTENAAAEVIQQLLSALQYMHDNNGIVHCNLNPNNILFLTKEDTSILKIVDFGMSKLVPQLHYYYTDLWCITDYYTAPEVIKNNKYNHSADMWSVGIILYVMMYGYPPFYVDTEQYGTTERDSIYRKIVKGFDPHVRKGYGPWFPDAIPTSKEFNDLMSKLLQKQVRKRYTASEALKHPWIVNRVHHKDEEINRHFMSRLVAFNNLCEFKLIFREMFRKQFYRMRPKHFHELEELFIKFDANNDGILSLSEFEEAILSMKDEIHIDHTYLHTIYDSQRYNGIQFSDLLNALVYDYLIACDARLFDAFRKLDDDNDGKITTNELKQKLKEIDLLDECDYAMIVIENGCLDQNGVIVYEEFLLNLHPKIEEIHEWMPSIFEQMSSVHIKKT